jgi:ATP-dependent RNA helicase RhlE
MRNTHRTNYRSGTRRQNGHFRQGFRGAQQTRVKKLDPMLFVKKATGVESPVIETVVTDAFTDYAIGEKLQRNIVDHGYTNPTPIQQAAIPPILAGRDVIGIANTGTGKTAAFLIPLLRKVSLDRNQRVLIVVPTRELAQQIRDEYTAFARGMELDSVLCIGGANMQRQIKNLAHKPHFVIGTPGRLKDLIKRQSLQLSLFQNIVLDEVDRMVDIGFIRDIQYLIALLPKMRQSLFFSATVNTKTNEILRSFVTDAVTVSVKQQETGVNIDQDIVRVGKAEKLDVLHDLLIREEFEKVLIFGQTKWGIEKLTKALLARGFNAAAIHGNKSQGQRQRVLRDFKENNLQILLATDVASRGLDIADVTHVINYEQPASYEDYIHRIGRTGRAGKKGTALTFVG